MSEKVLEDISNEQAGAEGPRRSRRSLNRKGAESASRTRGHLSTKTITLVKLMLKIHSSRRSQFQGKDSWAGQGEGRGEVEGVCQARGVGRSKSMMNSRTGLTVREA